MNGANTQFGQPMMTMLNQPGGQPGWWQSGLGGFPGPEAAFLQQQQQQHQQHQQQVLQQQLSRQPTPATPPPPPPAQLSLEALLAAPTLDSILSTRSHSRPPRSAVSDITAASVSGTGASLVEVPRAMTQVLSPVSPKPPSGPSSPDKNQPNLQANPSQHDQASAAQEERKSGPPARRNPWDDDDQGTGPPRGSRREGSAWEGAVANALAALQQDPAQTAGASSTQGMPASSSAPSVQQLQDELRQLQILQKQQELQALQVQVAAGQDILPSPPSPQSIASSLASLAPQAPLHELQRANLKRSSSASSSRSNSMSMRGPSGHMLTNSMSMRGAPGQGSMQRPLDGVGSAGQGVLNGTMGAPQQSLRRQGSRRGAYPDFPSASSGASGHALSDAQVMYGANGDVPPSEDRHRHSNGSNIDNRGNGSAHMSSDEPWGGVLLARGFAAVQSIKRREGMASGSGTPGDAGAVGYGGNRQSGGGTAMASGSVTITGPDSRSWGRSLTATGPPVSSTTGLGNVNMYTMGSSGILFPVYVRPDAKAGSGAGGQGGGRPLSPSKDQRSPGSGPGGDLNSPGADPSNRVVPTYPRALSIHREEAEDDDPNSDRYTAISQFTTASQFTAAPSTATGVPPTAPTPSSPPPAVTSPTIPSPQGNDGRSPDWSGGGANPRFVRLPSFGVVAGSGKFKVRPQLLIGDDSYASGSSVLSPSSRSPATMSPGQSGGGAMVGSMGGVGEGVRGGDQLGPGSSGNFSGSPSRRSNSLNRAQQRAALGSHQIQITMTDFKASHV